jgi:hypothetical protein
MTATGKKSLRELVGDDHDRRMDAARKRAEWELGDASWAGVIVGAYLYPDEDAAALASERD